MRVCVFSRFHPKLVLELHRGKKSQCFFLEPTPLTRLFLSRDKELGLIRPRNDDAVDGREAKAKHVSTSLRGYCRP